MKKQSIIFLAATLFECTKIEIPFNPLEGSWKKYQRVYEFESNPKTIKFNLEIDFLRPLDPTIDNDIGDPHFPCNINQKEYTFTDTHYIFSLNNKNDNGECQIAYNSEYFYEFYQKNDSLVNIILYIEKLYDMGNLKVFDIPEFSSSNEAMFKEDTLIIRLNLDENVMINKRKPVAAYLYLLRD